ncbi:hypothetical protein [Nocardia cyriacigeorgica]|uniref:hypothetical protein n=1 Tax=Nocardia cyriacigeorgica TaxID=135487 RepID=UPI00158C614A|nr:hypothetical protein [Nocardia cyriacigeorgica]
MTAATTHSVAARFARPGAPVETLRESLASIGPTAVHWLTDQPEQLAGVPGTWWVVDDRVFVTAKPGDRLDHDGDRIAGVHIRALVDGAPGVLIRHEDRVLEVIQRSGRVAVRVHESAAAVNSHRAS